MNSQYKIGDISRLFNLSSEMIRYYEKMGIIDPIRDEKNGYRYYSIFDIYILFQRHCPWQTSFRKPQTYSDHFLSPRCRQSQILQYQVIGPDASERPFGGF